MERKIVIDGVEHEMPGFANLDVNIHAKTWEEFEEAVAWIKSIQAPGLPAGEVYGAGSTVWFVRETSDGRIDLNAYAPSDAGQAPQPVEDPRVARARAIVEEKEKQ